MESKSTRRLIWIPIIHTESDLGSLSTNCEDLYTQKMGAGKWEERRKTVEELWQAICRGVADLPLDYERVRLYQDGLPNCGYEDRIVGDLAAAGSQNHLLLANLIAQGAKLTGTESPELLKEEYELHCDTLASAAATETQAGADQRKRRANDILRRRDLYIAQRINNTLADGETGLVFLGMLHSIQNYLAMDMEFSILGGLK